MISPINTRHSHHLNRRAKHRRRLTASLTLCLFMWLLPAAILSAAEVQAQTTSQIQNITTDQVNIDTRPKLVMAYIEFEPYYYTDAEGQARGHLIDLARQLADQAGYQIEPRSFPTRRAAQMLATGQVDLFIGRPTLTQHTNAVLVSKQVVDHIRLQVFSTEPRAPLQGKASLKGKKVVILRGYSYGGWTDYIKNPVNDVNYLLANNRQQALRILTGRGMDYLLDYELTLKQALARIGGPQLYANDIFHLNVHIMVSKSVSNAAALLEEFEAAFRKLGSDNPVLNKDLPANPAQLPPPSNNSHTKKPRG